MNSNNYKPSYSILLLCKHRAAYQRNIVFSWFIVLIFSTIIAIWVKFISSEVPNSTLCTNAVLVRYADDEGNNPLMLSHERQKTHSYSFFTGNVKAKCKIVKDSISEPVMHSEKPILSIDRIYNIPSEPNVMTSEFSGTSLYKDEDYDLPQRKSFIKESFGRRLSFLPPLHQDVQSIDNYRFAQIEWVKPRWPRAGRGLDAVVEIQVRVSVNGDKECKILKEVPLGFDFAQALIDAIDQSIFWPAIDNNGNNLTGYFRIKYRFCTDCESDFVEVVKGDVIIRKQ